MTLTQDKYQAPGAGASNRTVESKLNEIVSVKDFGAVGDGVTDDTAAIQDALDSGGKLLIPEGDYVISSTIDFSDCFYVVSENAVFLPSMDTGIAVQWTSASGTFIEGHKLLGNLTVDWVTSDWTKDRTSFYIQNVYNSELHLSSIDSTVGIRLHGLEKGCVHNDIHVGKLANSNISIWCGAG